MPLFTLREPPRDDPRKTRGQDGIAISFPVRLFHSLLHAGLSRRTTTLHKKIRAHACRPAPNWVRSFQTSPQTQPPSARVRPKRDTPTAWSQSPAISKIGFD